MHPILFQFSLFNKNYFIGSYGVIVFIALCIALTLTLITAKKIEKNKLDIFIYSIIIFSNILFFSFLVGLLLYSKNFSEILSLQSPVFVSWGGMIGLLLAILFITKRWNEKIFDLLYLFIPPGFIAMGIGRIGCHFGGCCYGIPTKLNIGIKFTSPIAPASLYSTPLLPVQLISTFVLISAGIMLFLLQKKFKNDKIKLTITALFIYSIFRFIIEFFRNDPRIFFIGLSDGQIFSVLLFLSGLFILQRNR